MSDDGKDVIDKTADLADEFQEDGFSGGVTFNGVVGYHTYFDRSAGIEYALQTAFHAAVDEVLMEVALDPAFLEENHGEVTPATAAEDLNEQLKQFTDLDRCPRLVDRLTDAYEETLRSYEDRLEQEGSA